MVLSVPNKSELTKYFTGTGLEWRGKVFADQSEVTLIGNDIEVRASHLQHLSSSDPYLL
jgi:hypothetical protein